jgi:hypothetical protein
VAARWGILSLDLANFDSIAARNVDPTVVLVEQVLGWMETVARLGSVVVFLVWVYQAASSVRDLGREGLTRASRSRPGCAWAGSSSRS